MESLIENAQISLLVFVRIYAIIRIAPLLSSGAIPGIARTGLSLFTTVAVLPAVLAAGYPIPEQGLGYAALVVGEAFVGIIIGFILVIVYSAFLVAGQFFSLQMGFGASQVYDPLAQIEIPLMGQFLNILGMFVFVSVGGLIQIFVVGVQNSFIGLRAADFVAARGVLLPTIFRGLTSLFEHSLVIAFPVLGTLFLVSLTMGLLAKAAPQMNLLMLGFPIAISVAFVILFLTIPTIMNAFGRLIDGSFTGLLELMGRIRGGGG